MIPHILIDGNNVIGKSAALNARQKKNPQDARELFVMQLNDYYRARKEEVSVFFDGFEKEKIAAGKMKIVYSRSDTADSDIRKAITREANRKRLTVVTSDRAVADFAKKCSCRVLSSEEFIRAIASAPRASEEEKITEHLNAENNEFVKLFTAKKVWKNE